MNKFKIFYILSILILIACQKKKLKGFDDPIWKEKSIGLTEIICNKIQNCSIGFEDKLKKKTSEIFLEETKKEKCIERFKSSNVYHLRGGEPNLIQSQYEKCSTIFESSSCSDIEKSIFLNDESCKSIQYIQTL